MRYAIIADIHGNADAFEAVLQDAKMQNAEAYIFAGDYCPCFPYPNEVLDMIQDIGNKFIIKGNEDTCFEECAGQDKSTWTDGQFQARYWTYREMRSENHDYLRVLPEHIIFRDNGIPVNVTHKLSDVDEGMGDKEISSRRCILNNQSNSEDAKEQLLKDIKEYFYKDSDCQKAIHNISDGIYIFAHTHIQWNAAYENKIFINAGSCGLPLDGITGAAYTILDIEKEKMLVTERRVPYDIDRFVSKVKNSGLYKDAYVWTDIEILELTRGFEHVMFFLQFTENYANKIKDPIRPYSVKTWTEAYRLWKKENKVRD